MIFDLIHWMIIIIIIIIIMIWICKKEQNKTNDKLRYNCVQFSIRLFEKYFQRKQMGSINKKHLSDKTKDKQTNKQNIYRITFKRKHSRKQNRFNFFFHFLSRKKWKIIVFIIIITTTETSCYWPIVGILIIECFFVCWKN